MTLNEANQIMTNEIVTVLANNKPTIYLFGSVALDDFQLGWSDIDILVLTVREITEQQAETLVGLRQALSERYPGNPYFRLFEGGMLSANAFIHNKNERTVYWGTSGQCITDSYNMDSFGMAELLDCGILLHGDDIRSKITYPTYTQMRDNIARHVQAARTHGVVVGWLLDIARGIYTLRTGKIIAKTAAGEWALDEGLCSDADVLQKAVQIRKEPQRFTKEDKSVDNAVIQRFADVLEAELKANYEPYYLAYERRYQAVYASGATIWGHQPDDNILVAALTEWVNENDLKDKSMIEYACGEGSVGVILSKLGCIYKGVDIAPSAVERSKQVLAEYPTATVSVMDMVNERVDGVFDAAIDCMGFHMLITDSDRQKYLTNANAALKPGAPMLFFRQDYRADAYSGAVATYEDWKEISGANYETPSMRQVTNNGKEYQVNIPLVPARGKNKADYINEMTAAGFVVDRFVEMEASRANLNSVSIYVHKGGAK
ncbi:MAG: methyltransferase domain-containing protein [Clostridiales bacterium]|nr:methyltransferase domain-containing protein [Clostridiales bacterium]